MKTTQKKINLNDDVSAYLNILTTVTKDGKTVKYDLIKEAKKAGFSIDGFTITNELDCSIYIGYSTSFKVSVSQITAIKLILEALSQGVALPTDSTALFSSSTKLLGLVEVPGLS